MGGCHSPTMLVIAIAVFIGVVQSRAVNISNTWMLPEEGFPVFYRYFRDRISWYEADAVCQFHHANLVTADSSSQYDAIRAYLKELDITEKVWIGLSKTSEKTTFSWTNFQPLTGEGHWQEALPTEDSQSLCAVTDPTADFLWHPLPCGGPEVAAFICELPIPAWAQGPRGCLLTELPSLTVLYIPEQSALELTSDCGLDGTKRIACRGDADREDMLKQLTCAIPHEDIEDEKSVKTSTSDYFDTTTLDDNSLTGKTTKSWTSNTVDTDYGMPTRHRRETEDTLSPVSTTKSPLSEVTTTDVSWKLTQRDAAVLTTQQNTANVEKLTPTAAPVSDSDGTTDVTTATHSVVTLDSSVMEKVFLGGVVENQTEPEVKKEMNISITNIHSAPVQISTVKSSEVATTSPEISSSTTENNKESVSTSKNKLLKNMESTSIPSTIPANLDEYPSAINQGQLFSIIENGTMFDIIELNETEQEILDSKTIKNPSTTSSSINKSSTGSAITALKESSSTITSSNETPPTKKPTTKKPLVPTKRIIKEESVSKPTTSSPTETQKQDPESLNKEFVMLPEVKDTSLTLNRTFRKEVPPFIEKNGSNNSEVPKILGFTVSNKLDFDGKESEDKTASSNESAIPETNLDKVVQTNFFQTHLVVPENGSKDISKDNPPEPKNPIDPRIYMLNHHTLAPVHHENLHVTTEKQPSVSKAEFLPRSLLGQTFISSSPSRDSTLQPGTTEPYSDHPFPSDEPKKMNRHRSLHTTKPRKFYPYFFSRMLG
ncbi:endochitinase A [Sitophilus oryzae]|uniref:Endochitinase A n=1 Tax=Sitophilus oryzae TaxID=7048 RepID=A0A6J2XX46_SITOR|nr:endochitinase A [Sitophilus oryzae]